ncbi:adenylate isopentenyltransferase [Tripterygium wilfordii]|uniref:adenylate dimethylallyltransferase (ADP/ATP-dependent) n=1 Tax=Tripterygium wilfordii TaxID=458696 RepID=A0A7J7CBK0_TRIWF|nr:adenylate isopentenyltransferase 3, chloroplastic-like [Tripterygium wilfordii]KAF5731518.1 adenylate isopentenyltransferase [Tripterygium wilfordii]
MRLSMIMCKQPSPMLDIPNGRHKLEILSPPLHKEKVVIVMGATGTGKSRLSIDLATRFPAEIVNSDKMQVYQGLDVVTNKITEEERCDIPHHLLGIANPNSDFTAKNFRDTASIAVESILDRDRSPIIVGGSNSYIEALVDGRDFNFQSRYKCCFLWIDISMHVLKQIVSERVDQMIENGMVDEAREFFNPSGDYSKGIRRSIGVPEFDKYFRNEAWLDRKGRARLLDEATQEIKDNTCKLAYRQVEKIRRLENIKGWNIHRLDATRVFQKGGREADKAWKRLVAGPSATIVREFLYNLTDEIPGNLSTIRDHNVQCLMA